jgi:copper chaperone CopZ
MKTKITGAFIFIGLLITFNGCSSGSATIDKGEIVANATASFTVEGMTCEMGCAKTIEKKIAELPGVKKCNIDFEKKTAAMEIDDAKFSEKELLAAVADINGGQYVIGNFAVSKK